MGEEAFDEVIIPCEDGMVLHVTGGYGREDVCLGQGCPHGAPQGPAVDDARRAMKCEATGQP